MDKLLQEKIERLNRAVAIVDKMALKIPARKSPVPVVVCKHCGQHVHVELNRCTCCGGQTFREF